VRVPQAAQEATTMVRTPSPRERGRNAPIRALVTNYGRYQAPESLASDARLSPGVRIRLLQDWAADLTARLRASDESMTSDEPGRAGELLRRVHVSLEQLVPPRQSH
jgi:hypothetical protein